MRPALCIVCYCLLALAASACGGDGDEGGDVYPDVLEVEVSADGDSTYTVTATISSPYDTPERYADAWRVLDPDGGVLAIRELTHDHAGEQPFTRSLAGVEIPDGVTEVTVEGRDLVSGWGGDTSTAPVPGAEN